jgi:hypothetical protein
VRFAVLLAALVPLAASAEPLQHVNVSAFTLSADTTKPRVGVPFHLIVTLRLRQRVGDVRNLQLPLLAGLELLGDERNTSGSPQGTLYREIITLVANGAGSLTIAPATFDAIDARDGKAKEYASNAIVLQVVGPPSKRFAHAAEVVARVLLSAGVGLVVLGAALLVLYMRRSTRAPVAAAPEPPAVEPLARDRLREALAHLQADPTRGGAMRARAVLYRMVGAADGETLGDAMQKAKRTQPMLLDVLPAVERAAFTYEADLGSAIEHAVETLERAAS